MIGGILVLFTWEENSLLFQRPGTSQHGIDAAIIVLYRTSKLPAPIAHTTRSNSKRPAAE